MARSRGRNISCPYREIMADAPLWPADPRVSDEMLRFFLLDKTLSEIEYELANRPDRLRVPLGGPVPYQDAAVAHAGKRTIYFYPYGTIPASAHIQFVLQNSSFGTPAGLDLADYHVVASYQRPPGGVVEGQPQPLDTIELYERNS